MVVDTVLVDEVVVLVIEDVGSGVVDLVDVCEDPVVVVLGVVVVVVVVVVGAAILTKLTIPALFPLSTIDLASEHNNSRLPVHTTSALLHNTSPFVCQNTSKQSWPFLQYDPLPLHAPGIREQMDSHSSPATALVAISKSATCKVVIFEVINWGDVQQENKLVNAFSFKLLIHTIFGILTCV